MTQLRRIGYCLATLVVLFGVASGIIIIHPAHHTHAQFIGATQVPGFFSGGVNAVVNAAIGNAGAVTNPASNSLMLIQGGSVYCNSSVQTIGQSTINLSLSTTYLLVWNCNTEQLYAKTAVTGPGSPVSTTSVGTPATILAPTGGEISLATVVCNATACGNGGNGSITDARSTVFFPGAGMALNTTLQANLPSTNVTNGTMIFCTDCTTASACTGAGTGALAVRQNAAWKCF
jgi:hypothetical protein